VGEIVRTRRLLLRRFESSDVDNLLTLYGDAEVMRFLDAGRWDRARIESETLPSLLAEYRRYRRYGYFAAQTLDGAFVGRIGVHPVILDPSPDGLWENAPTDTSETVSIGYRLTRPHWGRGYATEAAGALLAPAFEQGGARHAVATTMAVNHASRKVLERLGFAHTRTVHLDWEDPLPGTEQGEVVYERARPHFT
jgi:RimJ/RimL family protein N-acetyltransferase